MKYLIPCLDGIRLAVHLTPKAKREQFSGIWNDEALKITVMAPPVDSKANTALIEFLSFSLKIPKKQIEIASGLTARDKKVMLYGDAAQLTERVMTWIQK